MRPVLQALQPNRIGFQIGIVIFISLLAIHAILTGFLLLRQLADRKSPPLGHPGQIETLVAVLDATAPAERDRVVASINAALPALDWKRQRSSDFDWTELATSQVRWFGHRLEAGFQVTSGGGAGAGEGPRIAVRLRDDDVVSAQIPPPPRWRPLDPLGVTVLSMAIIMILLGLWAARGVTGPLRSFASAAESFSPEGVVSPLPERGPEEVRTAARAFNQMRERIKSLVDDRTRTFVAVGHDLRTPITRLRLSSEFVVDDALRSQMLRDIDQMKAMVDSILHFLRQGRSQENAEMIDVAASIQTICDQFSDMGYEVHFRVSQRGAVRAHPDELQRVVTNLVDNAVRYAGSADVSVMHAQSRIVILVEDEGPGIPQHLKARMLQPFVRGEHAGGANSDTGLGLGLSIAREIVTMQGGTLTLHDHTPRGLAVRIELPALPEQADDLLPAPLS
jgi:signal transduction histidine kinase